MGKQLVNFSTDDILKELERRKKIVKSTVLNEEIKGIDKLINRINRILDKERIFNVECVNLLRIDKERRDKGEEVRNDDAYVLNGKSIKPSNRFYRNNETPEDALANHIKMMNREAERHNEAYESMVLGIKNTSTEDFFYTQDFYDGLLGGAKCYGKVIKKVKFCISAKLTKDAAL